MNEARNPNPEIRKALPYFRTPERIEALTRQLQQWVGTRWAHAGTRPNEMRCGVTGDCLFWVHAFKAIGALPAKIEIPDYRKMEAAGDSMYTLRTRIMTTGVAECVYDHERAKHEPGELRAANRRTELPIFRVGDVLLFTNGMSGAHTGLACQRLPVHFAHLSRNGFNEEPLNQAHWLADLFFVYRLLEADTEGHASAWPGRAEARPSETAGAEARP